MKTIIITLFITGLFFNSYAQKTGYEKITEKRVEYIAPRLKLTATEAQTFWPLFYEFYEKRNELLQGLKKKNKQKDAVNLQTDEQFKDAINLMIESKIDQADLLKQYNEKYLAVLTPEKVYRLYQLDDQFNKELLKRLKGSGQKRRR